MLRHTLSLCLGLMLLAACTAPSSATPPPDTQVSVPAAAAFSPLAAPAQPCADLFVPHALAHAIDIPGPPFEVLDGNGSGLALGDLDGDGRIDIVLGNLSGPNAIFWNLGEMRFRRQNFGSGGLRGLTVVDADGDGRLDIVGAHRYDKPILWHNTGADDPQRRFVESSLPGVNNPAYTLTWSDLDGSGRLALVAASYDTELLKHEGQIFTQRGNGVGVFVYRREGDSYSGQRLINQADALALALPDLDGDGQRDLVVGNDFNRPDVAFLRRGDGWEQARPFARISENTMSLDVGDIDNDGRPEIFAADMKPFHKDTATMAEWLPMMKRLTKPLSADDPQQAENALQTQGPDGRWRDIAYASMLDSSGWSWSSRFGDLDNDGFLDVYVVNGMMARGLFDHLPNQELVEENMAFRNDGRGTFHPVPQWRLGLAASGRAMSMADLDSDGDLDIVVNNLRSPALVLENRLCAGQALEVDLRWSGTQNLYAIGAQLQLFTSAGVLTRDIQAAGGYLSGDVARAHFGIPAGATIERLEVRWPDGMLSTVSQPQAQMLLTVTR